MTNGQEELEYRELLQEIQNGLTEEQNKILAGKLEGYSLKEIAANYGICERHVYYQFAKIKSVVAGIMKAV